MPAFALALLSLDGVGRGTAHRILDHFDSAEAVRAAPREQVLLRLKGVARAAETVDAIVAPAFDEALVLAGHRVAALAERRIAVLAPGSDAWPAGLDALPRSERPAVLYAFGDLGALAWPALSVLAASPLAPEPFEQTQAVARGVLARARGLVVGAAQVLRWGDAGFGDMDVSETVRTAIPAVLGIVLGFQTSMFSMFAGILTIPTRGEQIVARPLREADEVRAHEVVRKQTA